MDINASTASQAYAAAKPVVVGAQDTALSGEAEQTRQVSLPATATSPAFVLDISTQVLKVEKLFDMSEGDRQALLQRKQQIIDRWTEITHAQGREPDFSDLDGKDINFSWGDGSIKTWRADGYVVTTRTNPTADQQAMLARHFAEADADRAAEYSTASLADGASTATANSAKTVTAAAPTQAAPAADTVAKEAMSRYAKMQGYTELKLSDLSADVRQKLLSLRKEMQDSYASRGMTYTLNVSHTSRSGLRTVLTADDRVITFQQDASLLPTPEQIAQRKAADEQNRRETEAQLAAQAEWEKKWGIGIKVSDPEKMTATELGAAREVAGIEQALRLLRGDMSLASGATASIKWSEAEIEKLSASSTDRSKEIADLQQRINASKAEREALVKDIYDNLKRIGTTYGFKVEGNLVTEDANGRFHEGTYTLTKNGGGWALKVDSAEGIMLSIGGGAFTRNFKRMARADTGPSPILTENAEDRAARVQNMS